MKFFRVLWGRERAWINDDALKIGKEKILFPKGDLNGIGSNESLYIFRHAFHGLGHIIFCDHKQGYPLSKPLFVIQGEALITSEVFLE